MDDRFRNEGTNDSFTGGSSGLNSFYSGKVPPLGDFSVNIDSNKGLNDANTVSPPRAKKFEVHIPDIDDEPIAPEYKGSTEMPPRPVKDSAPAARRPSRPSGMARRAVNPSRPLPRPTQTKQAGAQRPAARPDAVNNGTAKKAAPQVMSAAAKRRNANRKYNFIKSVLVACVCLIFITIMTVTVSTVAISTINDILVLDEKSDGAEIVTIQEGWDYDEVFQALKDKGLIKQPFVTNIFCKFRHYDEVEKYDKEKGEYYTVRIQYEPGTYYLDPNSGIEVMLEEIMVKNNYSKDTVRLTFPEGWSIAQVFEKIDKYKVCDAQKLYANLDIIGEQYGFISEIQNVEGRYLKAEGYLFPDTYDFFIDENAGSVLKKLFNNFDAKWVDEYNTRLKELGMTLDQIINIAAMIQREAKDGSQMKDISSVIHNRLKDSATYPNLEMNSTKDYITSLKPYNLFSDAYYSIYLDKYNTYSIIGLPPGPICNPGISAIEAALYPSDTDYYFFCHDTSTGEIYLAETIQEHQANTAKVLYGDIG